MTKILTISVAAYNVEKYLDQLLLSIIDTNILEVIEILIVNDGSKDKTAEIAKKYEEKYPNSIKLINKQNGGHGSTINRGIEEAKGRYFRAIDGDDWVNSKSLAKLVENLELLDADLVLCDYSKVYENGREEIERFPNLESGKTYAFEEVVTSVQWMRYHTIIYKTSILKSHHVKLDEHCFYVDTEYDIYPIPYISTIFYFGMPVYCYRFGFEGQSVSLSSKMKNISHGMTVATSLLRFYETNCKNLSDAPRKYIVKGIAEHCVWYIQSLLIFHYSLKKQREIKDFDNYVREQSEEIYQKMEDLGKNSRIIISLRRSNYYSYWLIKTYKNIKKSY